MNSPTRDAALIVVGLMAAVVAAPASAQSDVPGTGASTFPRFMIIFDNSRSMQTLPSNDFDQVCAPNDDFVPGSGVATNVASGSAQCSPASPGGTAADGPTQCRNKFCIGKSVMYDVLDSYASLSEVGFATYYQYLRRTNTTVPAGTRTTTCTYDVLAGSGEIARTLPLNVPSSGSAQEFFSLTDMRGTCYPTKALAKSTSRWYRTPHSCVDRTPGTPALLETAKTCRWPNAATSPLFSWTQNFADIIRYNDDFTGATMTPARYHSASTASDPYWAPNTVTAIADAALPGSASTVVKQVDTSSPNVNYYLYSRYWDPVSSAARTRYATIAPSTGCVAPGTIQVFSATPAAGTTAGLRYGGVANWGCTAANPCEMTRRWTDTPASGTEFWYESMGTSYVSSTTYSGQTCTQSGSASNTTLVDSRVSLSAPTCSATVSNLTSNTVAGFTLSPASNCTSERPCDLTGGASNTNTVTGRYAYDNGSYVVNISGTNVPYSQVSSSTVTGYYDMSPSTPAGTRCQGYGTANTTFTGSQLTGLSCSASGNNLSAGCLATLVTAGNDAATGIEFIGTSEPRTRRCNYTVTQRNFTATYYNCRYTRSQYNYNCGGLSVCQWQRTTFTWKPRYYRNEWLTVGGELLGTSTFSGAALPALGTDHLCGNAAAWNATDGFTDSPGVCPGTYVGAAGTVCAPPRVCKLTWRAAQSAGSPAVNFNSNGRLHNVSASVTNFNNTAANRFCTAPDRTDGYVATTPAANNYAGNWCGGSNGPLQQNHTYTEVMSDPYSPTSPNTSGALGTIRPRPGDAWPSGLSGEVVVSTTFSTDGTTWTNEPVLPTKTAGWSRTPAGQHSLNFVDVNLGTATLPSIKQIMSAYNATTNPNGLRMADALRSGQNTPLFGSLTNARDYLKDLIETDSAASCRDYAVLLVTDGQENQPNAQPHYDPAQTFSQFSTPDLVTAVTDLKNIQSTSGKKPKSLQTFVIGFGDGAATPAGQTNPLDLMARAAGTAIPDPATGAAYQATDATTLRTQIFNIFGSLTANTYTRSKPVLSSTGNTVGDKVYYGFFRLTPGETEWKGFFNSYSLSNVTAAGTSATRWRFSDKLDASTVYTTGVTRRVYTYAGGALVNLAGTLTSAQRTAVMSAMGLSSPSGDAEFNRALTFLLNTNQNAPFQDASTRDSRLSAVYHSTPAVMGGPPYVTEWPGTVVAEQSAYNTYKANYANREGRVYIGSNSGMMHAVCDQLSSSAPATCRGIASTGGEEAWSFVPPTLLGKVANLYRQGNLPMVDGSFGAADVCTAASCTTAANWRTQLIGSLREGGRSLFAMNVTDPSSPLYEWSFAESNFGESWSPPVVVRVTVGSVDKYVALVGGGYAPSTEPEVGNRLYAVDVGTGAVLNSGSVYAEFRTDRNAVCSTPPCSFPIVKNSVVARPAVTRVGETSRAELAFTGDIQGRISRQSFSSNVISDWAPARFFDPSASACATDVNSTPGGTPIYDADADSSLPSVSSVDRLPFASAGDPRAIYQRATLGKDREGRVNVYVGTGDAVNPLFNDTSSTPTVRSYEYFYALRDNNSSSTNLDCGGAPLWVKRFKRGQKVLSEATLAGRAVIIPTYVPSSNPCTNVGDTVLYAFDRTSGVPVAVFETVTGGVTTYSSKLVLSNQGISSDLLFIPSSPGSGTGQLVFGTSAGDVRGSRLTNLNAGVNVKGWRRRGVSQ
ncbi:MAG: pilus assembly protein [Myxococcaceae bacterium]